MFQHACKMGAKRIVSKRWDRVTAPGDRQNSLKFKNPAAPAVKSEAEEDWAC